MENRKDDMPDSRQDEVNEGIPFAKSHSHTKNFSVTITEKLQKVVVVEAETSEEAQEIITNEWKTCKHVLGAEDFIEVKFEALPVERSG